MTEFKTSGWEPTDTRLYAACSRCKAEPGEYCRSPKGRKTRLPHGERITAFRTSDIYDRENYTLGSEKRNKALGLKGSGIMSGTEFKRRLLAGEL